MTKVDDELGKQTLAPLRSTPPLDPDIAAETKRQFLLQAEILRQSLDQQPGGINPQTAEPETPAQRAVQPHPLVKLLVSAFLVLLVLVASSITVYAAQSSLPGDPLYPIKSLGEDLHLALTFTPAARLNLTLGYTNRRIDEISSLVDNHKTISYQTSERFQKELDSALQLAAQMDDPQMQNALTQISSYAGSQGMTIQELISILPSQADPAIVHLQDRLTKQLELSSIGQTDPQAFRRELREMQQSKNSSGKSPTSSQSGSHPAKLSPTSPSSEDVNGQAPGIGQSTQSSGHNGSGNNQSQSTQSNSSHSPIPTHTPVP